jgi:hypothetical protein
MVTMILVLRMVSASLQSAEKIFEHLTRNMPWSLGLMKFGLNKTWPS